MPFSIDKFHENRRRKGRTFVVGVNESTFAPYSEILHFGSKEILGKVCLLKRGIHHLQTCYYEFYPLHIRDIF
jgi:hypothetical protein